MNEGFYIGELIYGEDGRPVDFIGVDANPAYERQTGKPRSEIVGRRATEAIPGFRPVWLQRYGEVVRTGRATRFEGYNHATGKWFEISAFSMGRGSQFAVTLSDITARKQAEEALRRSETFLNDVFDGIRDSISVLDRDLNIVRANRALEERHRSHMPLAGKKCYQALMGASVPCDFCPSLAAMEKKASQSAVVHIPCGMGMTWIDICAHPLIDDNGNVVGVIEHARDVTEHKNAEDALRSSEARFRALFENAGAAIVTVDDETGTILDCNSNAEQLFGRTREEIAGMSVLRLHPPDDAKAHHSNIVEQAGQGRIVNYEAEALHKDGRKIPVIINATPVMVDGRKIMMGFFIDISWRKQVEDSLRESEEKFRALTETVSAAICILQDGKFQYINPAMEAISGYSKEELMAIDFKSLVHSDSLEYIKSRYASWLSGASDDAQGEFNGVDRNGTARYAYISRKTISYRGKPAILITGIDITKRKQAEEALRESEEKFRVLTETSSAAVCILQDGRFKYVSPAMEAISGYTKEELMAIDPMDIVHPDMKNYLGGTYARWMACPDKEFRYELKGIDRRGETRWVDVSRKTIDYGGRPALLLTGIDITKRKRVEEALRHSEERYRQLSESSADFIYIIDRDFKVQYLNRSGSRALRMKPEDAIGKDLGHLFPPRTSDRMKESLAIVFATGKPRTSEMVHEFTHENFYIHVALTPLFDSNGDVSAVMGVSRDINDLKRAESALRESEEKFRVLAETSPTAICVFRGDQFVYVNPAVERISGYRKEEFLAMKIWDLLIPECRDRLMARAESRKRGENVPGHYELGFYHKDRGVRWVDITMGPVNIGGAPAFIVSAYDVTERKRVEADLLEAKAQAELYLDLMGHDINNMHQMALGYLEIARDTEADEGRRALLDKPVEVLERSARLIRNVRKLQRLREGTITAQTIDLCLLLSDLALEYESRPGKTVSVNLNGHAGCYVRANELLYDVFSNLAGNAIKHTDDSADIRIGLDSRTEDGRLCYVVSVEDNGPGIPDDFKEVIFKRMLKGTTKAKGMGLGLYLVKSLVDSYQGRVWMEDTVPGDHTKGARFVVLLPAAGPRPEAG